MADGVAVLQIPKGATADAYLTVLTGPLPGVSQQTALARLPLPPPSWDAGISTLELHEGSGRVLLARNAIPANYRTAVLHISTGPLPDCGSLNLRWERPAAVALLALTEQPYWDWSTSPGQPPPVQQPPQGSAQTVYLGGNATAAFAGDNFTVQATGDPPLRLILPANAGAVACASPYESQLCRHVAIAVPDSVYVSSVQRAGLFYQEWCGTVIADCSNTTPISIGGNPYIYLGAGPFFALGDVELLINWSN